MHGDKSSVSHLCWQARTTFTLTNLSSQFVNLFALKPSQTFVLLVPSLQPQQITCLRPSITFTNCTWDQILLDTVPYTILIYIYTYDTLYTSSSLILHHLASTIHQQVSLHPLLFWGSWATQQCRFAHSSSQIYQLSWLQTTQPHPGFSCQPVHKLNQIFGQGTLSCVIDIASAT